MITDILLKKIAKLEAELLLAYRQHQWFAQERDRARQDRAAALAALDTFVVRGVAAMVPYQKDEPRLAGALDMEATAADVRRLGFELPAEVPNCAWLTPLGEIETVSERYGKNPSSAAFKLAVMFTWPPEEAACVTLPDGTKVTLDAWHHGSLRDAACSVCDRLAPLIYVQADGRRLCAECIRKENP